MYDEIQVDDRYKKFWLRYLQIQNCCFESRPNENSKTAWIQLWLAKVDCHQGTFWHFVDRSNASQQIKSSRVKTCCLNCTILKYPYENVKCILDKILCESHSAKLEEIWQKINKTFFRGVLPELFFLNLSLFLVQYLSKSMKKKLFRYKKFLNVRSDFLLLCADKTSNID